MNRILSLSCCLTVVTAVAFAADSPADADRPTEDQIVESLSDLIRFPEYKPADLLDVATFASLAKERTLANGTVVKVWSDAIEAAQKKSRKLYIPKGDGIYYLDRTLYVDSDSVLMADPEARIYSLPDGKFSLLGNRNSVSGAKAPENFDAHDSNIVVTGGAWSQERENNGGSQPTGKPFRGAWAAFFFSNVKGLSLTRMQVVKAGAFAFQISNARDVFLSDLRIQGFADAVHLNGPLNRVVVQKMRSHSGDDSVALNAWDWPGSAATFGPIENVLVQDCEPTGGYCCFRLLPGIKRYESGATRDCPVRNVVIRNIRKIRNYKMYAQEPVPITGVVDLGVLDAIYYDRIVLPACATRTDWTNHFFGDSEAPFEILADARFVSFKNIALEEFPEGKTPPLVVVGPRSFSSESKDAQGRNYELFEPNLSCKARCIEIGGVTVNGKPVADPRECVKTIRLTVNPDFPKSLPGGGTGHGEIEQIKVLP